MQNSKNHPIFRHPQGSGIAVDVECYINYFLVGINVLGTDEHYFFEIFNNEDCGDLDYDQLFQALFHFVVIGFNYLKYDDLMIHALTKGWDCAELKKFSDLIITEKMQRYASFQHLGMEPLNFNIIDIIEVAPLKAGLKQYAARLHVKTIQELPYPPSARLSFEQAANVKTYNKFDLFNTVVLYFELLPYIELRYKMSDKYKIDLRSKSDAQIAEHVIVSEIEKLTADRIRKPKKIPEFVTFKVPEWATFETPVLQNLVEMLRKMEFRINPHNGKAIAPKELRDFKINIAGMKYTFGIGGLHSTESCSAHNGINGKKIAEIDFGSFYPENILKQKLFPIHIGPLFLEAYNAIVQARLFNKHEAARLKKLGDETWHILQAESDGLKIVINGGFGKFGNVYSALYSPDLLLQVTLSGQLGIFKVIEHALKIGFEIISANTDGVVLKYNENEEDKLQELIEFQSKLIGAPLEKTEYAAIYARDVNNYFAVKTPDKKDQKSKFLEDRQGVKVKGAWAERGSALNSVLSTNPTQLIVSDAVINYLVDGKPPIETLKECKDFRRFIHLRAAKDGATYKGEYAGKVLRFYKSKTSTSSIKCAKTGNQIAGSEFVRMAQELSDGLPDDLDFGHYYEEIKKTLYEIGAINQQQQVRLF